MARKIWVLSLEPVETRYTKQWFTHIPELLESNGFEVEQVDGNLDLLAATPGGFLNFSMTNVWKSQQAEKIITKINNGEVSDDDAILVTDGWNPVVLMLKYIKDLTDKKFKIVSLWHAGSYIKEDLLGQKIKDKDWSYNAERAMFHAVDYNCFASYSHIRKFTGALGVSPNHNSIVRTGFPMEYIDKIDFGKPAKENIVVFPHRNSPEKMPYVFDALAKRLTQYKFVNCQKENMNKEQYHETLAKSKVMFSAAQLETLGICQYEAMVANCIPMVPDHLSYAEMYYLGSISKYPSNWLDSPPLIDNLARRLTYLMENYETIVNGSTPLDREFQKKNYFSSNILINLLKGI